MSASATVPAVTPPAENDAHVFEVLRSAVTLAKNHQIRTLKSLTSMLETLYPGKEDLIKQALALWGRYERSKPNRYPGNISFQASLPRLAFSRPAKNPYAHRPLQPNNRILLDTDGGAHLSPGR